MSLLEDITDLLRCVLEYFGVPPDMLVPVWESTYCGQYRSIILLILRFIIPLQMFNLHADVLWLVEDEGDSHTKLRSPGGTPVRRRRRSKGVAFSSDPAALIAKALKRNHNNRVMNCFLKKKIILLSEVHLRRSHGFCIKNIKI
uniref:Mitochondrial fission regulator 2 n=1 Tax=Cyprinus carpio TaxID=7962 RepID=A0A8C2BBR6_CYPCA